MSVRSFHSVFMATAVAGAALGCYLISLRVASERAALQAVEAQIVGTQSDIRLLQTEIGTRARLAQLERWNVRVLSLSAPSAGQILGDKFQLASLVRPEPKPHLEAPVVLATAPAPQPNSPLGEESETNSQIAPASELLHQASVTVEPRDGAPKAAKSAESKPVRPKPAAGEKKAGEKTAADKPEAVTKPVRTAKVDPLAPLPAGPSSAKGSRTQR